MTTTTADPTQGRRGGAALAIAQRIGRSLMLPIAALICLGSWLQLTLRVCGALTSARLMHRVETS